MTTAEPREQQIVIAGEWRDSINHDWFDVINPANGELVGRAPRCTERDVELAIRAARTAFASWSRSSPDTRSRALHAIATTVEANEDDIAELLTLETGNAIRTQSRPEVRSAAAFIRYFAGTAAHTTGSTSPAGPEMVNYTIREPLGVVGAIIPWNSPIVIAALKLAMSVCTGNTIVLKSAEEAPLAAAQLAKIFDDQLPPGVVNLVAGYGDPCGTALVNHPGVDKLTFTGSTAVGRSIMKAAAERITPISLELGGKNPAIVFPDSDTVEVARGVIAGMRFTRQGQSCTAGSRLFVHEQVFESFMSKLTSELSRFVVGDPSAETTDIGAIINSRQYERIRAFVAEAVGLGGRALIGAVPPEADRAAGLYVAPTVLTDVDPSWRVAREEVFGPVLVAIPWRNVREVIEMANDSHYGLSAYVWCQDGRTALRVAQELDSGWVQINRGLGQTPGMTYGGFKQSGLGAECSSEAAIACFTRTKTITVGL